MLRNISRVAVALIVAMAAGSLAACTSQATADEDTPSDNSGAIAGSSDKKKPPTGEQCGPGHDDAPGRGRTAEFEVAYLRFIINHHFGALRMTELAAGTDLERDSDVAEQEGTALTPGFEPVEARAVLSELRSLARRNNRQQREEILSAQDMLRMWYGMEHQPQLTEDARRMIEELEAIPRGEEFDRRFIEMFSRHHFSAIVPSIECQVSRELEHQTLETFCRNTVVTQTSDIQDMRHWDCDSYRICDLVPVENSVVLQ